ncbi:hypothetical protein [Nocardia alni]|uniref:hypothetical protein n=1 Tax=Nocardia alni TaxID=2815723 RepID=UPI001C23E73F|nr:hypothetical protein [Nocardia alni]
MNIFARIAISSIGVAATVASAGIAAARPPGQCASDWRGDTVCINVADGQVRATGHDDSPGATVFLTLYNATTGTVVAGPVVDRSLHVDLPPGAYYANYYVATTDLGDAQINSPIVAI